MNCPNCNKALKVHQILSHSWSSPITCKYCGMQWHFVRNEWYKTVLILLLGLALFAACNYLAIYSFNKETGNKVIAIGVVLFLCCTFWGYLKIINIKLENAKKKT